MYPNAMKNHFNDIYFVFLGKITQNASFSEQNQKENENNPEFG